MKIEWPIRPAVALSSTSGPQALSSQLYQPESPTRSRTGMNSTQATVCTTGRSAGASPHAATVTGGFITRRPKSRTMRVTHLQGSWPGAEAASESASDSEASSRLNLATPEYSNRT
jgi:hypothetical protein